MHGTPTSERAESPISQGIRWCPKGGRGEGTADHPKVVSSFPGRGEAQWSMRVEWSELYFMSVDKSLADTNVPSAVQLTSEEEMSCMSCMVQMKIQWPNLSSLRNE